MWCIVHYVSRRLLNAPHWCVGEVSAYLLAYAEWMLTNVMHNIGALVKWVLTYLLHYVSRRLRNAPMWCTPVSTHLLAYAEWVLTYVTHQCSDMPRVNHYRVMPMRVFTYLPYPNFWDLAWGPPAATEHEFFHIPVKKRLSKIFFF